MQPPDLPAVIETLRLFDLSPEYISASMLFICAIAAITLERWVMKWGMNRSMAIGLAVILLIISINSLSSSLPISIAILVISGIALGILFIAQIPWCLSNLPIDRAGLATGLYFGGMGAANALVTLIIQLGFKG